MSLYALSWAFEQTLPPNEKIVLLALADCENGETLRCDPKQSYIAEKASVSERQVRAMLASLEQRGLIERTRRGSSAGGRKSDNFWLACRPQPVDNSGLPADSAGRVSGRNEGGFRQAVAGIENRKEPEVNTGQVPDVTSDARELGSGTGPVITPATFSKTHRQPLDHATVFAAIGDWLPTTFTDGLLDMLAGEILDAAAAPVVEDPTAYVIRSIRNTVRTRERIRGKWLLRADELAAEYDAHLSRVAGF